ncbi:Uncharacterized protein (Fragment) OS=uncultured bacterium PE=4 SV=1 [Gemmata massiliana]|uniref:DUF4259 domain-containing protein n=1 Tax=Gemmata massiliana TaxID=1210884 RepID=A0A6P2D4B7_9BACT
MGVWGAGNFQSDAALDYLGSGVVAPLIAKLQAIVSNPRLAEPDERASAEVMVAVDVLCELCERLGAVPPEPELVEECGATYLRVWEGYIDKLSPKPGYKAERRRAIETSFDELLWLARKWHEQGSWTAEVWLNAPVRELLRYAHENVPTIPSRWLEFLWHEEGYSPPPRQSSRWKVGLRGRKHWLLILAITRLYWAYLSPTSRELIERLQQNEERPDLPNDDELSSLYSHALADALYPDGKSAPEIARLAGMGEAIDLSELQWTDIDFDGPPERYENWRPLIYDVFGNPFRPVAFSRVWRTETAVALARRMYESRDFGAMPILADALEDAGCDRTDVLDHCRGGGPHARGCWVIDLLLNKE